MKNFLKAGYSSLKWTIIHEHSAVVLKNLCDLFKASNNHYINELKKVLEQRLVSLYGVVPDEALFLLDLELKIDFFNIDYLTIYSSNSINGVINGNYMMCAMKDRHIVALNLSNWGIAELPESIGSLLKLKHLILRNNNINTLPNSIGLLRRLRTLDLNNCKINGLPDSLSNLKRIKNLSLSQNINLKAIPKSIFLLANKFFYRKYIWEGVPLKEAIVLGLFEILSGSKLKKIKSDEFVIYRETANHYKINHNGNVIGIYIFHLQYSKLTILPEELDYLKFIEEIEFPNNDIKIIPKSIGKLTNLQRLNLRNNIIEEIPESLSKLKNLNCLKLSGNKIKKIPEWINLKLDKFESTEDLNGFKRYFFGIPIGEVIRRFHERIDIT